MRTSRFDGWMGVGLALALFVLHGCGGGAAVTKKAPEDDPMFKFRMAQSLMNAGRVGEALASAQEGIAADPDNAVLRLQYGQICFRAGRYAEAEGAFAKALELNPYMTDARNFLGAVYHETGRFGEAESVYLVALEDLAYPTPELVYLNLGLLYADLERDEEAIEAMRKAVGVNPKFFKAHFHLASMLERTGKLDEASREYEVAEPGFRNNGDYLYRLGFTYFRLGEAQKAKDALNRVLAVAPGSQSAARADELLKMMD